MNNICPCCKQEIIIIKDFDTNHDNSIVVWDNDAGDIAEEELYTIGYGPLLNPWESFKVYGLLPQEIKTRIKRYYGIH